MGDAFPVDRKYIFSGKTSNTSLRPHLEKYHCSPYMQMKALHGWPTNLPGQASQMTTGATPAQVIRPTDVFSEQTFHRHLINFIVADDQVCPHHLSVYYTYVCLSFQSLNVLECPEFRRRRGCPVVLDTLFLNLTGVSRRHRTTCRAASHSASPFTAKVRACAIG